jgi:enterochelin esterase-like enzyme
LVSSIYILFKIDNLHSQKKISSTVAVFVLNEKRATDLLDERFADFIAHEVLQHVQNAYGFQAKKVVISGPSRAAYTAASTAFLHSNSIQGVLSQSGSFYFTLDE